MAKIGLVTVLFHSDKVLKDFFYSLALQDFTDFHLYLVDNSFSEQSYAHINSLLNEFNLINKSTYINSNGNVGVAEGNNIGIKKALEDNVDYVTLINNDILFDQKNAFSVLLSKMTKFDIVVPKINYFEPKNKIWFAGGEFRTFKGLTTHYGMGELDSGKYMQEQEITYAPTCFMIIPRKVFDVIGLMDKKYFVYFDDTDFVHRCLGKFTIGYVPDILVLHKVSTTTGGDESPFSIYYGHRNRIYFGIQRLPFINKVTSLIYTLGTVLPKLVLYSNDKRKAMLKGVKDGILLTLGIANS